MFLGDAFLSASLVVMGQSVKLLGGQALDPAGLSRSAAMADKQRADFKRGSS